jgi:hypothetical protein
LEKNKLLPLSIIILAISIIFGSIWIGFSLKQAANKSISIGSKVDSQGSDILEFNEAAKYLKISESELLYLVEGRGSGINYIKINNKYIFSKEGLDKWVQSNRLEVQQ